MSCYSSSVVRFVVSKWIDHPPPIFIICDEWEIMLQFRLQMAQGVIFLYFEFDLLNVGKKARSPFHTILCHSDNFSSNDFNFDVVFGRTLKI